MSKKENANSKTHNLTEFKNLLAIALADGMLDKNELDYLFKVSDKFYITPDEIQQLISGEHELEYERPTSKKERILKLHRMVEMMLLDGEADLKEYRICMSLGVALGFDEQRIESILDKMIDLVEADTPAEKILELKDEF